MTARGGKREYPRSARVGELIREILGSEIEAIDDHRLDGAVVTGVDVDNELEKAVVYFDADDATVVGAGLDDHTARLRKAISRQARIRRTPRLEFTFDSTIQSGNRVEEILASLDIPPAEPSSTEPLSDEPLPDD